MSVAAIIVAAGRGERLGGDQLKQLLEVGGRTLLQRSVAAFDAHPSVDTIVVVLPEDLVPRGDSLIGATVRPTRWVAGGLRRQDSVRLGLAAVAADVDLVLVHDAARPFVGRALIDRVLEHAGRHGAAVPALQAQDTVKRVRPGTGQVAETIGRQEIWLAQTPQGFRRPVLEAAVALGATMEATDEAMLAEQAGLPVAIVDGDPQSLYRCASGVGVDRMVCPDGCVVGEGARVSDSIESKMTAKVDSLTLVNDQTVIEYKGKKPRQ